MTDLQKFCDELRAKISIVDVVGAKVNLVRKGREYQACCPFHNEKTPSFTVNETKGFYHCFGCGAHGDIIKFEMDANNLSFLEAIEKLANKIGLPVPKMSREQSEENEKRASLYDIMELAVKFFEKNLRLPVGAHGLEYLYHRGFDDEIISKFRLGYAPANNGLYALLKSKGIAEREMGDLGLVSLASDNTSKRTFDFFRDRVIIPIFDKKGRPIAFGGRVMNDGQPKYLNSPETPIFNKRRILYNMNNARDYGYAEKNILICEGYMDVIALDKYGFHNAVAPLGTALTEEQIQEAWKVCNEPTCCFDGDGAGVRAAMRSADRVLPILKPGNSLKFLFLPDKQDPDEFLKAKGRDAFIEFSQTTLPLKDILWWKNVEGQDVSTPEHKALVEKNIKEEVSKIADETVRNYYVQEMQNRIYNELGRGYWKKQSFVPQGKKPFRAERKVSAERPKVSLDELVVKFVLAAMMYYPELIAEYEEKMSMFEFPNPVLQTLFDKMVEIYIDNSEYDRENMIKALETEGFGKEIGTLWELKMFRQQNPYITKIREEIDMKIVEVQLRQLENEIRECLRVIETSESFPEETYQHYESLKKEKDALLNTQNFN